VVHTDLNVLNSIDNPQGSAILILGVESSFSKSEAVAVRGFVENGGTLVLADDTGAFTKDLFVELFDTPSFWDQYIGYHDEGYTYRVQPGVVRDITYDRAPDFVVEKAYIGTTEYKLTFNAPASLKILEEVSMDEVAYDPQADLGFNVMCETTEFSWVDTDGNGARDPNEKNGYLPLIISMPYNSGNVVLCSDPGLFINENWNRSQNAPFLLDLLNLTVDKDRGFVFLDNSKHFQDSFIGNSAVSLLTWSLLPANDRYNYIIWVVLILLALFVLIKVDVLPRRSHISIVNYPWLARFKNPFIQHSDYLWMRSVFLEKVRILTGFEKEDFYRLSREELEALVYDPALIRFLFDSSKAPVEFKEEKGKPTYYEEISARMGRWSPKEVGGEA
jgi:hypothetical protein